MYHKNAALGDIHKAVNWVVADEAARLALSVSVDDLYKICWQIDTATAYILTDESPVVWKSMGGSAVEGAAFSAYLAADQAITASGVFSLINFTAVEYNLKGAFNTATKMFTAPEDGLYAFKMGIRNKSVAASGDFGIGILKNGVMAKRGQQVSNAVAYGLSMAIDLSLAVGDTIQGRVYSSVTTNTLLAGAEFTFLQGRYVRSAA